ncbi:GIDE domain-containing protein [Kaarinaea lacus]
MSWIESLRAWALNTPTPHFWIITVIVTGVALAGLVYAFVLLQRARVIEDTPTSKIRSAAQGYVELHGHGEIMQGLPIISPLTGIQCTWYRYKVEKIEDKNTRVIQSGTSDDMFLLVGDTGRCVIDPEGAVVNAKTKQVWYEHGYPPMRRPHQIGGFLGRIMGGRYRYTEERMHIGEELYAIGMFMSVGGHNETFNTEEEVRELIKKWKQNRPALLKHFDKNGDGEIDVHEWEEVRKMAHIKVRKDQLERSLKPPTHVMSKPKYDKRPFILSVYPQHELVRRFRIKATACFAGFFIAGSGVVWTVSLRLINL